jgi:hypothetical protein
MAKFSQTFLQGLLQPSYQEGLFTAARGIGMRPQMQALQQQQQEELQRFDESTQISEQGIAAAQQGDVSALTNRIAELRKQMAEATTLQEKQRIRQEMNNLQRMRPGAEQVAIGNKARSIVQGEQALQDASLAGPARVAIQQRLEELKKDPEAMRQYNQYKMDEWRTGQAQEQMEAEQWLNSNSSSIDQAIQDNDIEAVQEIILKAGDFSEAAQSYVNTSLRNAESMSQFQENSLERKKEPSVDFYEKQINELPEEVKEFLAPTLTAYREIAKSWNGENWTVSGSRARAAQLEKTLQTEIAAINRSMAISDYRVKQNEEADKRDRIKALELKINTPMDNSYIREARIYESALLKKGEELSEARVEARANQMYQRDRGGYIEQLAALEGKTREEAEIKDDGGFSVKVNGQVTTRTMVQEAVALQGLEKTKTKLKDKGLNDQQIRSLLGEDMSESAPTQEELITRSGLINPQRAKLKLRQGLTQ